MALHSLGIDIDPGHLNAEMQTFGGYIGNGVYWDPAVNIAEVQTLGTHNLKFHFERSTSAQKLNELLCSGNPVIVQTNLQALQQGGKGHFVLVIGSDPSTNTFFIADPAGRCTTLGCAAYNNQFETRGYVHDPTGDISRLVIASPNSTLLVTSPTGQQTGTDPATGQTLEKIPQSVSFTDAIANDVTFAPATESDAYIDIFQAAGGVYQMQVTALTVNPSTVSLDGFSQDGSRQPQVILPITGGVGAITTFQVKYSSAPGAVLQVIGKPTALTYTGDTTADYHDSATLSAILTDTSVSPSTPVSGETLTFTLGKQSCTATTNSKGQGSCTLTVNQAPGAATVQVSFAGDSTYLASNTSAGFTVTKEQTTLTYTGDTVMATDQPAHLSAVLTEDSTTPIAGRTILFALGSGASAQTCSGTTDATGTASCTIASVSQPLGPGSVTAQFAGDAFYQPSSATTATLVFAYLATGSFVVGDQNAQLGNTVTFWGAQWAKVNTLSGGPAPASFKGFAASLSSTPASCGGTWSTGPGNSVDPPNSVPSYMGVVVSSSITQSDSTIAGNIPSVIVIQTESGYAPDPGHPGTGTVVGVVCPAMHL